MTRKNQPVIYATVPTKHDFVMKYEMWAYLYMKAHPKSTKPTHSDFIQSRLDEYEIELKKYRHIK